MVTLNQSVFLAIHHFAGRHIILDDLGIFFANYLPYFLGLGFLVLVWQAGEWRRRVYLFAEGAIAVIVSRGLITEIIRFFYHHPRPFDFYGFTPLITESGSSFPSGHMTFFFALAMVIWYADRKWGIWYFALSALCGVARIYVGVHWPLDIIGGAVIGLASGWFVHWLLRNSRKKLYGSSGEAPSKSAVQ